MANNGVYYSSAHTLNFTTTGTTWATLTSGGTFQMNAVSATTYYNLPSATFTGGTVTGPTIFTGGLTANTLNVTGNTTLANTTGTSFYTNYIDFNTSSTPVNNEGRLIWNNADEIGGLEVTMMSGNTILQIGEENLARVYNADTVTLTAGTVVYVFGSQGNTISVKRASNSGETTSSRALGVVSESIAVGARGFVNTFGLVKGLNTLAYSGGTPIWLGTTPGSWTSTEPDAPNHTVLIGFISRSANSPNGSLFVHINNGWELNELHNVYAPSPSNGDILKYSAATSVWVNSNTINLNGVSATTISATTYQNLPQSVSGTGNVNYVPKWSTSDSLTDSLIQDDGTQVNIGGTQYLGSRFSVDGPVGVNGAQIQFKNTSIGITDSDLTSWGSTSGEIAIGIGGPLLSSTGYDNIAVGNQSMSANTSGYGNIGIGKGVLANNTSGYYNVAVGEESLYSNTGQRRNVAIGYQAGYSTTGGDSVFIGSYAGYNETGGQKLYIANSTTPLIYGEFNNNIVGIIGTLTATTYNNLPVSAVTNGNGISTSTNNGTVTVTNTQVQGITGKTDGAGISSSISNNVITITNTDLGSSQNIFKNIQITGTTQFSAGSNSSNLNFSGINITIFSAASNTLVFSAGTGGGGGGSGTVTSVALSAGTSGSDINIVNSAITTSGTITINIPDASATARGVVSTGTQTFKGNKTFDGTIGSLNFSGDKILYSTNTLVIGELSTTTYPSLTELSYVKGVTSAIQTQLNNKFATSGGTVSGNLTVTGTTTSATISATTYQNLPVSAVTNGTGISTSTSNGTVTITNTGVTGITAGNNITIDQSTGNVTINSIGGVSFGNVYTTANNFNFL